MSTSVPAARSDISAPSATAPIEARTELSWATLWNIARRDLSPRLRGLRLLWVCLFLGVATLAAIGSLTHNITSTLEENGQVVLGGDLEFEISQRFATASEREAFTSQGRVSESLRTRAMAHAASGEAILSELKAVDSAYPLYGQFRLNVGERVEIRQGAPASGNVWVSPDMVSRLALNIGDELRLGTQNFRIEGLIVEEPDRLGEGFTYAPIAIIAMRDVESTGLIQPGSLFDTRYRLALPQGADRGDLADVADELEQNISDTGWSIDTRNDGAPGTRRFVERMGQFLTLVGLAALAIAGIGVGNGVASYLKAKRPSLATLKILGADSKVIGKLYGLQIAAVAAAAILAGLLVGALAPVLIKWLIGDLLPMAPGLALYPQPLVLAASYGLLITLIFAAAPIAASRRVPATAFYRMTVENRSPLDRVSAVIIAAALVAIIALAITTAYEPWLATQFIVALFVILLVLALIGQAVQRGAARLPRPQRPLLRLALYNLHRPGAATGALILAFGLGLTLFVALATIHTSMVAQINNGLPEQAPNFYAVDIPRDQAEQFRSEILKIDPQADVVIKPVLRGTVTGYGSTRVADLERIPEGAWILRGDRGLTYSTELPALNELVEGEWWPPDYAGAPLVSLSKQVADSLGVGIGDSFTTNIFGVEHVAEIAALHEVDWANYRINFAIVYAPSAFFAQAPHQMAATITTDAASERRIARQIPQIFPTSPLIATREIAMEIKNLLTQMSQAIAYATSMTILAGIAVLVGAIAASRESRLYDSIILKLLGATRGQIFRTQAMEYALLSVILSLLALGVGMAAGYYVIVEIFDFAFEPDPLVIGLALAGGAGLTFIIGLLGSLPMLSARPASALRDL